ncbi:sec-independent protein translocase protein TatC [Natronoarchaeum philippinense]|uniref:Sec-independent protein translocase protein TatC n=1 Tax=Natronoarchaeum philippinense TaxID=558529 RepID=A0A285P1J4_NATPI|nr:twin-arginine translocase subunit TatC [Natronoarchaeum philippinense]SNZ15605.1 sec-independent protein translocase protein TatC [Natronoarchaeum philippinense]
MAEQPDDRDESVPEDRGDSPDEEPQDPPAETTDDAESSGEAGADEEPTSYRPYHDPSETDHTASDGDEQREANGVDADDNSANGVESSPDRIHPDPADAGAGHADQSEDAPPEDAPHADGGTAEENAARTDGSHTGSGVGVAGTGSVADETGEVGIGQPPDDQEMPLADHVEEMINRLAVVLFAASVVTVVAFPIAENLITTVWYGVLPNQDVAAPHVYGPLELKLTELKLASLAGLTVALPVAVYETYLFMRPGLYPNERRYYLAAVPTSLILALVGIAFAYFLVLPGLFTYFMYYSDVTANVAFGLRETFNLILTMMGMLAVVFQIPLLIMLAIMMGITSRAWLAANRLYFWGAFLGIAFLFSPDPTGMAPLLVATTMVLLYEGTLLLLRWVGR